MAAVVPILLVVASTTVALDVFHGQAQVLPGI
jgi:hypothetical protein